VKQGELMPVRSCDQCHRYFIFDRDTESAPPCPHCASPMRLASSDEAAEFASRLEHEGPRRTTEDEPA
jgi:transcription initiation factor IIE alpha subunit